MIFHTQGWLDQIYNMKNPSFYSKGNALIVAVVVSSVILSVGASVLVSRGQWQMGTSKVSQRTLMEVAADADAKTVQNQINQALFNKTAISAANITGQLCSVTLTKNGEESSMFDRNAKAPSLMTYDNNDIVIPKFWSPIPSSEVDEHWLAYTAEIGRDDPYRGILSRREHLAFVSSLGNTGTSDMAQFAGSSLTQVVQTTFRTFPVTAFLLFDRRGEDVSISATSSFSIGSNGRIYTEGAYLPTTTPLVVSMPMVNMGGVQNPGYGSSAKLYVMGAAIRDTNAEDGYVSGTQAVLWGDDFAKELSKKKQTSLRGALFSADDKLRPLYNSIDRVATGNSTLTSAIQDNNFADVSIRLGVRTDFGHEGELGVPLIDGVFNLVDGHVTVSVEDAQSAVKYTPATVAGVGGAAATLPATLVLDVGKLGNIYPALKSVFLDVSSGAISGAVVYIKNSTDSTDGVTGMIRNGISVVSNGRINILGGQYGSSASAKNLIIAPEISTPGNLELYSSVVTSANIPNANTPMQIFTRTQDLDTAATVQIMGSLILWETRAYLHPGSGQTNVVLTGDLDVNGNNTLADGRLAPPLTPAVTDIRIGEIRRSSGTFQAASN